MALTKITGQVINDTTGLVVGVTTVGGGISATDGFFSGIVTAVGDASFSGNVSVGGTLTYEDVTNIDAVGIITARSDVLVGSGITLSPDGDIFFTGIMTGNGSGLTGVANTDVIFPDKISLGDGTTTSGDQINIGVGSDLKIVHNNSDGSQIISATTGLEIKDTGGFMRIRSDELKIQSTNNETYIEADANGSVQIFHDNSKKLETASGGVTVTGTVAATSYTGDGSALTGIDASSLSSGGSVKVQANASGAVVTGILTATKGGIGIGSTTYSGRVAGVSTVVGTIQYDAEVNKVVVFTKALQWQGIHEVGQLPQLGLMGAYNFFMPRPNYSDFSNTEQVRCASAFFSRYDQGGGVNQTGNAAQYCTNSGGLDNGPYINYVGRTDPSNHFFYLGYGHTHMATDQTSFSCWYRGDNSVGNGSWHSGTSLLGDTRNSVAGNFGFNSAGKICMHIGNNSAIEYSGSKVVNDNVWHCLGFVSSPSAGNDFLKLYVDGELVKTTNSPGYHNNLYLDCVGGNYDYADQVPERMAATAMWNRELTDAEMKQAFLARNFNSMGNDFVDIKNN